ncbi:hypothetical protein BCR35DRAFT_304409 [Leucosporidium creatinivorum]|uniref:F-box domain-containing protein n=1 Tax=Leucosporidium creatinivorum TaxID=106004 RepID=A0A1Y2F8L8_9BASI|nr:hypothetical protein BCR35DRAFT_304409 [Leucosporidium creatinivorum]
MASLSSLPPELLHNIFDFLPTHTTSIRPRSALLPLLTTSRYLHAVAAPLLNSDISIGTLEQADAFLRAKSEDSSLADSVTTLVFHAPSSAGGSSLRASSRWTADAARRLVKGLSHLSELRLSGFESVEAVNAVLEEAIDSPKLQRQVGPRVEADSSSSLQVPLIKNLHLDFEGVSCYYDDGHARRTSLPLSSPSDDAEDDDEPSDDSEGSKLSSTLSLCCSMSALEQLSVSHLPRSARPLLPPTLGAASSLRRLALDRSNLSDEDLLTIAMQHQDTLQQLSFVRCGGFGRSALISAVAAIGSGLKSLRIEQDDPVPRLPPPAPSPQRSPLSSPTPSSRTAPSTPLRSPSPSPAFATAPNLYNMLDTLLPHTPSLQHLSFSNRLASPQLIPLLPSHTPNLLTLSIAECLATPITLLPLLNDPNSRLARLRRLEIDFARHTTALQDCEGEEERVEEQEGLEDLYGAAMDREVKLVGEAFEKVKRKISWAQEFAGELVQAREVVSFPPRRLKRAGAGMR